MHPGKGRVADGDLDPKYHDRSQRSSLYTIGEAQNASLGDNHGTIVQAPHFPEISTFGTKNSNIRDQLYIQGGKVKIYLGPDSQSPKMTLQRRGIIEVLSQLLSSILGWVPPPSNHTEGPLPSMAYGAAFLSTGQRETYTESQGLSDASVKSPSTLSGSVLQEQVEPDSDIKTHSLGNCHSFSLLPLDDLDSQSLGLLDRPIPAEIYVGSMLSSGMGLACWNTKPHAGAVGPALGDVGTFSAQDGFIKIFNLWDDEESIRKTARTTGIGNYYRPTPMRTKRTIQGRSKRGDIVKSLGIRGNVVYKPDFSDIKNFEIHSTSERGAALLLTSDADQEDLDGRQRLRKHILDYPELFYRHADAIQGIGQEESLYIITGSVKSDSCALAAFVGEPTAPDEPAVILANSTRPGQHISSWVWTNQGTANTQLSECSSLDGEKDQTLFLRGFKLDFSSSFRSKLGGPASGGGWDEGKFGDGDDGRIGSEDEGTSEGGPGAGTVSNTGDGGSSVGRGFGTLDSSSSRYRGRSVQLQSFPDSESRRRSCHPCDIINECLLKATGSSFALSHDDDWLPFLKDQSIWESTTRSPLPVGASSGVCVVQGVACFKAEPEVLGAAAQAVVSHPYEATNWSDGSHNPNFRDEHETSSSHYHPPLDHSPVYPTPTPHPISEPAGMIEGKLNFPGPIAAVAAAITQTMGSWFGKPEGTAEDLHRKGAAAWGQYQGAKEKEDRRQLAEAIDFYNRAVLLAGSRTPLRRTILVDLLFALLENDQPSQLDLALIEEYFTEVVQDLLPKQCQFITVTTGQRYEDLYKFSLDPSHFDRCVANYNDAALKYGPTPEESVVWFLVIAELHIGRKEVIHYQKALDALRAARNFCPNTPAGDVERLKIAKGMYEIYKTLYLDGGDKAYLQGAIAECDFALALPAPEDHLQLLTKYVRCVWVLLDTHQDTLVPEELKAQAIDRAREALDELAETPDGDETKWQVIVDLADILSYEKGNLRREDLDHAIGLYRRAEAVVPEDSESDLLAKMAGAIWLQSKGTDDQEGFQTAIDLFIKAYNKTPDSYIANNIGAIYLDKAKGNNVADLEMAREYYSKASSVCPTEPDKTSFADQAKGIDNRIEKLRETEGGVDAGLLGQLSGERRRTRRASLC
ncbi:hypothetical protein D9611_013196 [Ephemerocybe angulata]|uniref:Uncharacterized protein n=1 Tax=Ephemerocybe angulata TaxID=980116 RepID=A0A8H5F9Y8_9AGAR|nr:hypothetical protein D9611_013196 [Tulosesus angulatus]